MKYGRNTDDYLSLYEKGLPKPTLPLCRIGTLKIVLTEDTVDEDGPIQLDVLYLAHYRREGTNVRITRVYYKSAYGNWCRAVHLNNHTRQRLLHTVRLKTQDFPCFVTK